MELAVVRLAGKEYLVKPGSQITVSGNLGAVGQTIEIPEVLLWEENGQVEIGTPKLAKKILAKIEAQGKGDKVRIQKFKAKSRYRRSMGFRPQITTLRVLSSSEKVATKVSKTKKS